jgi:hypothetical protein
MLVVSTVRYLMNVPVSSCFFYCPVTEKVKNEYSACFSEITQFLKISDVSYYYQKSLIGLIALTTILSESRL